MIRIGQRFKEERLRRKLSLEEVAKATKIRANFLAAIENGEYSKLPSSAYATGFVKNYANFLGLPQKETLALFRREFDESTAFQVLPEGLSESEDFSSRGFKLSEKSIYVIGIFLALLSYMLFSYRSLFISPFLVVSSPKDQQVVKSSEVLVSGKTDPDVVVTVNNFVVSLDREGKFEKNINVFAGEENIKVEAVNRFGKKTQIIRRVTVKGPQ